MSRRFFRPYYVANLLLVFSYTVFRRYLPYQSISILSRLGGPAAVPQWEMRVAGVLSLALSINGLKVPSPGTVAAVTNTRRAALEPRRRS